MRTRQVIPFVTLLILYEWSEASDLEEDLCRLAVASLDHFRLGFLVIHNKAEDDQDIENLKTVLECLSRHDVIAALEADIDGVGSKQRGLYFFMSDISHQCDSVDPRKHWLIPKSSCNLTSLELKLDSQLYLYGYDMSRDVFEVSEVYAFKAGPRQIRPVATVGVEQVKLMEINPSEGIWKRRSDLQGHELLAGIAEYDLFHFWDGTAYRGAAIDIFEILMDLMNCSYTLIPSLDGSYGSSKDGVHWNGLVGMLQRREIDASVAMLSFTINRIEVIDYNHFLYRDWMTLFTRKNRSQRTSLNLMAYADILTPLLWFLILITGLVLSIFLWIATRMDPTSRSCISASTSTFMLFVQRDSGHEYPSLTSRLVFVVAGLFSVMIFACYSGLLTSTMIFSSENLKLGTFADVLRLGFDIAIWPNTSLEDEFRTAPAGSVKRLLYETKIQAKSQFNYDTITGALDILETFDNVLVYIDASVFSNFPNVIEVEDFSERGIHFSSFATPKDSELKEVMDYHLKRMEKSGVLHRIFIYWGLAPKSYSIPKDRQAQHLQFANVFTPFSLLGLGVAVALGLVLGENMMTFLLRQFG